MSEEHTGYTPGKWHLLSTLQQYPLNVFLAGGVAGAVSRTCCSPFERVKILFQTQGSPPKYTSVWQTLVMIGREEGFGGYMKGNAANVLRIVPYSAIQFYAYENAKRILEGWTGTSLTPPLRLVAGALAGMTSVTLTYPLDMVRGRLTVQSSVKHYRGICNALVVISQQEGVTALFKGLLPTLIGIAPYVGLNFMIYESLKEVSSRGKQPSVLTLLGCGAVAGTVAQTVTYPLDVLRRKLQIQGMPGYSGEVFTSLWDAVRRVMAREGIQGFYSGLAANYLKVVPTVAISFVVYERVKALLRVNRKSGPT